MARDGVSRAVKEQILAMLATGNTISAISVALGLSRNTVKKYLRSNGETSTGEGTVAWAEQLDWPNIIRLIGQGVTIKQLHADYAPAGVSYWAFRRKLHDVHPKAHVSISVRQEHEPGRAVQLDFSHGIPFYDEGRGEPIKTHLFCGVLPFSSKVYAEFTLDQKLPSFLGAQERMWRALGGVTPYVVIDNLKAGVKRAHRYDPDINQTYCDFGNHYGFAVLPARPYHPKDKAAVEAAIGVLQRSFYQEVRERRFNSLNELNESLRRFLAEFHNRVMKDYNVSRNERFAAESKYLLPLPNKPYEFSEWREAKVHPDCCVQIQRNLYSVPHVYVGQLVRVKMTAASVSIYDQSMNLAAVHKKLARPGQSSIDEDHYPEHKMQMTRYEIQQSQRLAREIGPRTSELVSMFFEDPRPLRYLRRVQGILRLYSKGAVSIEALEYASAQALTFRRYRLAYFEDCARNFDRNRRPRLTEAPERDPSEIYLHLQHQEDEDDRSSQEAAFQSEINWDAGSNRPTSAGC